MIKKTLQTLLLSITLQTTSVTAELYKGVDADGNVTYSDTPFVNSKVMTPPIDNTIKASAIAPKSATTKKPPALETAYTKFKIAAPINNETIWNEPQVTAFIEMEPELDTNAGHKIWLLMNGRPLLKGSENLLLKMGRLNRGTHTIQAQVRNNKNKVITESKNIKLFIKHSTVH